MFCAEASERVSRDRGSFRWMVYRVLCRFRQMTSLMTSKASSVPCDWFRNCFESTPRFYYTSMIYMSTFTALSPVKPLPLFSFRMLKLHLLLLYYDQKKWLTHDSCIPLKEICLLYSYVNFTIPPGAAVAQVVRACRLPIGRSVVQSLALQSHVKVSLGRTLNPE